jgi:nitrate reductase assembly molybdenum cofactor insertion protein NarJ
MKKKSGANRLPIIEWIETYYLPVFLQWLAAMGTEDTARQEAMREELADLRSRFPYSGEMGSEKAGLWVWIRSLLRKSDT